VAKKDETHESISLKPDEGKASRGSTDAHDHPIYSVQLRGGYEQPCTQQDYSYAKRNAPRHSYCRDPAKAGDLKYAESES
jgi:hypothetical protein